MTYDVDVRDMKGKTIVDIELLPSPDYIEEIIFTCDDFIQYRMFHRQECCEDVYVEDILGNLNNLKKYPIIMAEVVTEEMTPNEEDLEIVSTYEQWTFYKFATAKGYVTIRWYGASDAYSVEVELSKTSDEIVIDTSPLLDKESIS